MTTIAFNASNSALKRTRVRHQLKDFISKPGAFDGKTEIIVTRYYRDQSFDPEITFAMPIFNQEHRILCHLDGLDRSAVMLYQAVLILDGCTDKSNNLAHLWGQSIFDRSSTVQSVIIAETSHEVFETNADNIAAALAQAPIFIEVQADMLLEHKGFDQLLATALEQYPAIFAISGRGGHTMAKIGVEGESNGRALIGKLTEKVVHLLAARSGSYSPTWIEAKLSHQIGRCGPLIELPLRETPPRLYVVDTVMRGPLAFKLENFKMLGGFDSEHFFLGNDDHDLMARARHLQGWKCAYLPLRFSSPLEAGSTRAVKTGDKTSSLENLRQYYSSASRESFLFAKAASCLTPVVRDILNVNVIQRRPY